MYIGYDILSSQENRGRAPFSLAGREAAQTWFKLLERSPNRGQKSQNGESLYWCVGGKQVGKAALQFWHDTLQPLRRHFGVRLSAWPFESIEGKRGVVDEFDMFTTALAIAQRNGNGANLLDAPDCDTVRKFEGWMIGLPANGHA